jgi:hypothetical protein
MVNNFSSLASGRREWLCRASALGLTAIFASHARAEVDKDALQWKFRGGKVLSQGASVTAEEGTLHQGFQLEAQAQAVNTDFLPKARFSLGLQGFCPATDMGNQVAGRWYLKGDWQIEDSAATKQVGQRQWSRAGALRGHFLLETADNPFLGQSEWTAQFALPPRRYTSLDPAAIQFQVRGRGELTVFAGFDGTLSLALS